MIYIASIPRSGSTYVTRAVAGLGPGNTTPPDIARYGIYKTHRPADHFEFTDYDKKLFLFGDPVLSVMSTKLHRYEANHFKNCGAEWPPENDIYAQDILQYERIFDTWTQEKNTLCVKYQAIHDYSLQIEGHLRRGILWPPWQERTTTYHDVLHTDLITIQQTYKSLIEKYEHAEECWIV